MSPRSLSTTLRPVLSFSHSLFSRTATTFLLQFLLTSTFVDVVYGVLRNATIDDHYGDSLTSVLPEFLPKVAGIWEGEECGGCRVKPDPERAFRKTYNAATYRPEAGINPVSVQIRFTGNAIYAFLTLANNCGEQITTKTQANFTVDDEAPVFFNHEPDMSTTDFIYQYPAFSRSGLEHGEHTLSVVMSGPQEHLFLNFDYAEYTYDDTLFSGVFTVTSTASSSSSQPTSTAASSNDDGKRSLAGPIAGGVAGGVAIFAFFIIALFFIRRRKSRRAVGPEYHSRQNPSISTTPFPPYARQTPSQNTQSSGHAVSIGIASTSVTQTSGTGSRRPTNTPHIRPFTQMRSAADRRGRGRGHIPQQPSLSQTQLSSADSNRSPTPALSNLSSGLEYTSASSSSGQRAPPGQSALALPPYNSTNGDLERRVQDLQRAINSMLRTIQVEQDTLSRRGLPEEQINTSLETMRQNLAALAEQMTSLQVERRSRETWSTSHDGRRGGEDLPEYESPTLPSRRLPEP